MTLQSIECPNCGTTFFNIICKDLELLDLFIMCTECRADITVQFDKDDPDIIG